MNLLFRAAPPDVSAAFAPFLPIVLDVPDYTECMNNNERATVKATHAIDKKIQADIVTMDTALTSIFLETLSSQVRTSFLQQCLCKPNIIFVNMFVWFVNHYKKTTAEDRKTNCRRMVADWHPANGFDTLFLCLFNIVLRLIKGCGMYAKEYKAWIPCKAFHPRVVQTFNSFKTFWTAKIALVNQNAIPTS
jgi:hypothetical protein